MLPIALSSFLRGGISISYPIVLVGEVLHFHPDVESLHVIKCMGIENKIFREDTVLRKGLNENELQQYWKRKEDLINLGIHIDDTPGLSIQNLKIKAKMMKLKYDIKILFVDYLQLATYEQAKTREQEIGNISRGLKSIAKELDIPVVALSQLSREVEKRANKRPQLSDLRDSGSIEQDADEVIFLYRPEYYGIKEWGEYNNESTEKEVEIIIAKNRHGGILPQRCKVNLATSSFYNI